MKKKLITLIVALALVASVGVGATLAYLSDTTETVENVFQVGNINISVVEDFEQNSLLLPATGSAQKGTLKNGIKKEVFVKADDKSNDAFVRVHIAIPNVLDDGADTFDAGNNVLHFNWTPSSNYRWNWKTTAAGGNWNYYEKTIDDVLYNVYVVTYMDKLTANETTATPAMSQVYLDSRVTSKDAEAINEQLGPNWKILVAAEGVQADGFDDAFTALNAAFGTPTADNSPFKNTVATDAANNTEATDVTE